MAQPPPLRPGDIEHVFHYGPLGNRYRVEVLVYGHDEITVRHISRRVALTDKI